MVTFNFKTMKLYAKLLVCLLPAILIISCSSAKTQTKPQAETAYTDNTAVLKVEDNETGFNTSYDVFPEYRIMPGDILDVLFKTETGLKQDNFTIEIDYTVTVKFIHTPELNETQTVRPDGNITLPYIGDINVIGRTTQWLTQELKQRYSKILRDPSLYVVVPEFRATLKEFKADLHTAPRGLSRLVTVRPDGYVTFPIIGEMFVVKKTIKDVNKILNSEYEKIIPGLHVNLFLEKNSGFIVYVFGEVKKPGAYPILKPISIMEALAFSESFLSTAKTSNIIVLRKSKDKITATIIDLDEVVTTKDRAELFMLNPDDVVYVPKRTLSQIADITRDISDILFFKGWSVGFSWELHKQPTSVIQP
ncbi:MAG: polysaccharide biosynthesis/export family protein [Nitrospirae bacterium YQR-1]